MTRAQRILLTFSLCLNISVVVCLVAAPFLFAPPEGGPSGPAAGGGGDPHGAGVVSGRDPGDGTGGRRSGDRPRDGGERRRHGPGEGGGRPPFPPDMFEEIVRELDVTPEQRAVIDAEVEAMRAGVPEMVRELHDGRAEVVQLLLLHPDDPDAAREAEELEVRMRRRLTDKMHAHVRAVARALTAEQREQLGARMREMHAEVFEKQAARFGVRPPGDAAAETAAGENEAAGAAGE